MPNGDTHGTFNDIAKSFDPMMPAEVYDQLRLKYFQERIQPGLKGGEISATWNDFKSHTERPHLLTGGERAKLQANIAATSALSGILAPMKSLSPEFNNLFKHIQEKGGKLQETADREGMTTGPSRVLGSLSGQMLDFAAMSAALGPEASSLLKSAGVTGRVAELSASVIKGGTVFGAYDALSADSNRLVEGIKGFGKGAAFELVLGEGGLLGRRGHAATTAEADRLIQASTTGTRIPPEADKTVAQKVVADAQVAKQEGRAKLWTYDAGGKGTRLWVSDKQGREMSIEIKPHAEAAAYQQMQRVLQAGGAVERLQFNLEDQGVLNEFLRIQKQTEEAKYQGTTVRTPAGQEASVIEKAAQSGVPAEVVGNGRVQLHTVEVRPPERLTKEIQSTVEGKDEAVEEVEPLQRGMPPTTEQATSVFQGKRVQPKDMPFLVRSVEKLWDEDIPDEAKASERSIINRIAPELVPPLREAAEGMAADIERGEAFRRSAPTRPPVESKLRVPLFERSTIDPNKPFREEVQTSTGKKFIFKERPGGRTMIVDPNTMEQMFPGAVAATAHSPEASDAIGKFLGTQMPKSAGEFQPYTVLSGASRIEQYHEGLHLNIAHSQANMLKILAEHGDVKTLATMQGLVDAMKSIDVYKDQGIADNAEEAFVHASEAVRFNDTEALKNLGEWDTDVDHVKSFVNVGAGRLLDHASYMRDSVPVRNLQRQMTDLIRRTDVSPSKALADAAAITGSGSAAWYDPTRGWILRDARTERVFSSLSELWDHVDSNDKQFLSPNFSYMATRGGVRGGLTPPDRPPDGKIPPNPDVELKGRDLGWNAVSSLWRPMLPWAASLDEKVNELLRSGGKRLPIFDKVKAVDDQFRAGGEWMQKKYEESYDILKNFDQKKMYSVFDYLTNAEKDRSSALLQKLGLTQTEGLHAHQYWQFLKDFESDTNIPVTKYLLDTHIRLRGSGWDASSVFGPGINPRNPSFWEGAIRYDGTWNPQDAHLGRFNQFLLREGMQKKFTGQALKDLRGVYEAKGRGGDALLPGSVRRGLENYHNYMKGLPDKSLNMINDVMGHFFDKVNERVDKLNEFLPDSAQLPKMTSPPRQVINRMLLLSYGMGLGLRPAVAIRDMFQAFTGPMAVLGPQRFMKAFVRAFDTDAWQFAKDSGALMRRQNMGELHGDIFQEMPTGGKGLFDRLTKWSNMLLAPSRWAHNFGRNLLFNGEYSDALAAVKAYRVGDITSGELMTKTSLWFMDGPMQSQLLKEATDVKVPAEQVAKRFGLEATDLILWPYRRGTQPELLRYGAGRILGQYGVYPANYIDFMGRIGRKWFQHPAKAAQTTAMWAAVNYSLSSAMEAAGADTSRWFWQSPAGFAGSPNYEFLHNLMVAPENSQQGRDARKAVLEYPLDFVPGMNAVENILQGFKQGGLDEWPPSQSTVLRTLGFKPIDQHLQDRDWEDFVRYQMGFPRSKQ